MFSYCLFSLSNSAKLKDITFSEIEEKDNQQIFTFEPLNQLIPVIFLK